MTKYQILIDSITQELFTVWKNSKEESSWNEDEGKRKSRVILEIIETFKKNQ